MSKQRSTLLPKRQQCRTSFALKFRPFDKVERCFENVAQNGNIVEATGNKVACCFDIVASVDRTLRNSMGYKTGTAIRQDRQYVCGF